MKIIAVLSVSLVIFLAGCATEAAAPSAVKPVSTTSLAPAAVSEVIIMWAENASVQTLGVYVDGEEIGRLKRNRLVRVKLSPGSHELKAKFVGVLGIGMPTSKLKITCTPGHKQYVLYTYDYQINGIVPLGSALMIMGSEEKRFQEIDEKQAKEIIRFAGIY